MKTIKLTKGQLAIVDDEDFEYLNRFKWHLNKGYATRSIPDPFNKNHGKVAMHLFILQAPIGKEIDHKNRNRLDNQKHNLRFATKSQQQMNCGKQNRKTTSKYKGVFFHTREQKWRAQIGFNGKRIQLGSYDTEKEAAFSL